MKWMICGLIFFGHFAKAEFFYDQNKKNPASGTSQQIANRYLAPIYRCAAASSEAIVKSADLKACKDKVTEFEKLAGSDFQSSKYPAKGLKYLVAKMTGQPAEGLPTADRPGYEIKDKELIGKISKCWEDGMDYSSEVKECVCKKDENDNCTRGINLNLDCTQRGGKLQVGQWGQMQCTCGTRLINPILDTCGGSKKADSLIETNR